MDFSQALLALTSALAGAIVVFAFWRRDVFSTREELERQTSVIRDLEKQLHVKDRELLDEKNKMELAAADRLREAKSAAYEEGRQLGLTEGKRDHINELTVLRSELLSRCEKEKNEAVAEARERLRSEYELQTKLFSVKITPFVRITENKGLFANEYEAVSGYQYQLLVNGIPAFAPHEVPEQTVVKKTINEELERVLLQTAERAADAAIQLYLGGAPQFAKMAPPKFERIAKK